MQNNFVASWRLVKKYKSLPKMLSLLGKKKEDYFSQAKKSQWTTIEVTGSIDDYDNVKVSFHIKLDDNKNVIIEGAKVEVFDFSITDPDTFPQIMGDADPESEKDVKLED